MGHGLNLTKQIMVLICFIKLSYREKTKLVYFILCTELRCPESVYQQPQLRCSAILRYAQPRCVICYVTKSVNLSGLARRSPDSRGSASEGERTPRKQSNLTILNKWQGSVSIMFENWFFCCGDELYLVAVNSVASSVLLQTIRRTNHHPRTVLDLRDPGKLGLVLKLPVWHFLCLFVFLFVVELWRND